MPRTAAWQISLAEKAWQRWERFGKAKKVRSLGYGIALICILSA